MIRFGIGNVRAGVFPSRVICPGHGKAYPVDRAVMLATEQRLGEQQQLVFDILPEGESNFGIDPSWVSIHPYQALLERGRRQPMQLRARNYEASPMKLEIARVTPAEWRVEPDVVTLEIGAGASAKATVNVTVPKNLGSAGAKACDCGGRCPRRQVTGPDHESRGRGRLSGSGPRKIFQQFTKREDGVLHYWTSDLRSQVTTKRKGAPT
jgi:hypothetical protein